MSAELLLNGGFEAWVASAPTSWVEIEGVGCTIDQEAVDIHSGASAAKMVMGGVNNLTSLTQTLASGFKASAPYHFSMWHHQTGGTWQLGILISGGAFAGQSLQADGSWNASAFLFLPANIGASYVQYTLDFTYPAADAGLVVKFVRGSSASQTWFFDDVSCSLQDAGTVHTAAAVVHSAGIHVPDVHIPRVSR